MLHVSTTSVALADSYAGAIQIRHHGISLTLVDCWVLPVKSGEPFSTTARREMFPFLVQNVPRHAQPLWKRPVERGRYDPGDGRAAAAIERCRAASRERPQLPKHTSLCFIE
jgi:hypothetical protein